MHALAPYRSRWARAAGSPEPLPYLDYADNSLSGGLDIQLDVWLETARHREQEEPAERLSRTSFRHQYWTIAQMVAHHTEGGCNLQVGDLLGSGTISGPQQGEAGAMIELTENGRKPIRLKNDEERGFLADGDAVILKGWCEREGFVRIGFGEARGEVIGTQAALKRTAPSFSG